MTTNRSTRPLSLYNQLIRVPGALFVVNLLEDRIDFCELDGFFDYRPSEFTRLTDLLEIVYPEDLAENDLFDAEHGRFSPEVVNLRMRNRHGLWDIVQVRISPMAWSAAGCMEKGILHAVPVGGLKSILNHMLENEVKFRALVNQAPVGIFIIDSQGRVIEWNAREEEITGIPAAEVLGLPIWKAQERMEYAFDESGRIHEDLIRSALASGEADWFNRTIEGTIPHRDGHTRWITSIFFPIWAPTGLMVGSVNQDNTEIHRAELAAREQTRRAEAIARLSGRINAELDLERILETACAEIAQALDVPYAVIYLYHAETDEFRAARMFGPDPTDLDWLVQNPIRRQDYPFLRDQQEDILVITDAGSLPGLTFVEGIRNLGLRTLVLASMRHEDRLVGMLGISTVHATRTFSQNELTLLQIFCDQAAMALARARLFEITQNQSQHLHILNEITRTALDSGSLNNMLAMLVEKTAGLFNAAGSHISLWDVEHSTAVPFASYGQRLDPLPEQVQALLDGSKPLIQESQESVQVSLPLRVGDKKLGGFYLSFLRPHPYASAEYLPRLTEVASQLSLAVGRAILLDQERRHRLQAENLQKATTALTSSLNLPYVLDNILTHLSEAVPLESAAIFILDDEQLRAAASRGIPEDSVLLTQALTHDHGLFSLLKDTTSPVVIGNIHQQPAYASFTSEVRGTKSWMGIPLVAFGKRIGYLISCSSVEHAFRTEDVMQAQALTNQAAIAIQNARLFQEMLNSSERLQVLSKKLVSVQEDERRMLAHELHDEIGQSLTATILNIEMSKRLDGAGQKQCLDEAQKLVETIMEQVREISLQLRPGVLDVLGLLPALRWLFERYQSLTSIRVHHNLTSQDHRFLPDVEITAFRITQEALTNIARHAAAQDAFVSVQFAHGELTIIIEDQGIGFDPKVIEDEGRSFGITGMSERIRLVGGRLIVSSSPGRGTSITAIFPDSTVD